MANFGAWYWQTKNLCHMECSDGTKVLCGCDVPASAAEIMEASNRVWNGQWTRLTDWLPFDDYAELNLWFLFTEGISTYMKMKDAP